MSESIECPFSYANGKTCCGVIYRARAYGRGYPGYVARENVQCYRLWCSEKDDHAGAVPSTAGKWRMEFYPSQLADGVEDRLWHSNILN
jgi:hypothetical protein